MEEVYMGKYRSIRYLVAALVLFLFTSGFLGFCVGPDYKPCSIQFTDPVNGTVLAPGTLNVAIHGKVVAGDKAPLNLVVLKSSGGTASSVPFNKSTGEFTYTATLNDKYYTTITFEVKDTNLIANKERISIAVGDSSEPGGAGIVDNAVRLMLNENFLDQVEVIGFAIFDLLQVNEYSQAALPDGLGSYDPVRNKDSDQVRGIFVGYLVKPS